MSRNANIKLDILDLSWVILMVICGIAFSYYTHNMRDTWPGISPAPSHDASLFYGFGDVELSYRNVGLTLQNAGDTGGRVTNFKNYDYSTVEEWLWLADSLDPQANYVPSLAAYYFSAVKDPDKLRHLIGYLAKSGEVKTDEHWRWLGHAIYLSRFELKDEDLALKLARKLAAMDNPDLPMWTKVMPAYVEKNMGRKKDARDLLLLLMADPKLQQEQNDRNQSCWYIDHYLREPDDNLEQNDIFKTFCTPYLTKLNKEGKN
jgi:hypothetical protein